MGIRSFSFRPIVGFGIVVGAISTLFLLPYHQRTNAQVPKGAVLAESFITEIRPLLKKYCLDCHSTQAKKGSLDLERFTAVAVIRQDIKHWQGMIEQLESGEMPPKNKPQPTIAEKQRLLTWVREFLDDEARARSGDPGFVPLRRLSNAEYDATIRDLTGVDLRPTREFPADGAAGEGFTNAAEALTDISPALLTKYLNAAKDIAAHAVLLPDGFRFSPQKTRRDWTDESTLQLQQFYSRFATGDGQLAFQPYLMATVRHREAMLAKQTTIDAIAIREKLNAKYLGELWKALTDLTPSYPLDMFRVRWRKANESDVPAIVADIVAWQNALWRVVQIGSYKYAVGNGFAESKSRQIANEPEAVESVPIRLSYQPVPGQSEVVLHLAARDLFPDAKNSQVVWQRPRWEASGKAPLLLKDYAKFGPGFEVDYPSIFLDAAKYLNAAREAAHVPNRNADELAKAHGLDAAFLKRWLELLALEPVGFTSDSDKIGRVVPLVALTVLDEKLEKNANQPAINGWRGKGNELPAFLTNGSNEVKQIPGRAAAHSVIVHPTPREFVGVVWTSPIAARVRISARITDAHDNCGNGVAWWLEHRRGERASVFAEGVVANGGAGQAPERTLKVAPGDQILLAIDAHQNDHVCDLTDIALTLAEIDAPKRSWNLAADVADTILTGNPHADQHGNKNTWTFVRGPSRAVNATSNPVIASGSILAKWRDVAIEPAQQSEATKLAEQVQSLLSGTRPADAKHPDRIVYDNLVSVDSPLFRGVDPVRLGKRSPNAGSFGLPAERFGKDADDASLKADANGVTVIRLPAALFQGRQFVVEGRLATPTVERVVQFQAFVAPTASSPVWASPSTVVASPQGVGHQRFREGLTDFRRIFPLFTCFPKVIPTDEVVCLKMFHREDEPLIRQFLNDDQARELDALWQTHRFVSRQAVAENAYLPQFIGFVTQDQTKEMLAYFEGLRPVFQQRADAFVKEEASAIPQQLDALIEFASRAYRRPLAENEKADLRKLYETIRSKGVSHDEAFRGTLARIFISPAFLFRIEKAPAGKVAGPVDDWELATRLSYFLWSSTPDDELRQLAVAGRLRDPNVLTTQVRRMLQDPRVRSLAIEFGTQWIHVRGFDDLNEKNEKLFPTFDADLRRAMYEESILFFQDLFQGDRSVSQILDADATFLNESLANHYGIPGVSGPQWRRVDGVKKYGRGGVLGLGSVQTKQAGASRTSPILRGNWVVETLLGEKLPRPPANVPKLPEEERGNDNLTMRQLVEKHTQIAECATCHQRIDPFGFAMERYDPIGRFRDKDLGGLPVDARAKLKDGTSFEGIEGLRNYLLTQKNEQIMRLFCRRLLGYALGRSVNLSDTSLIDEMVRELKQNNGRVIAAIDTIVRSPQFRMVRGSEFSE